MSFPHIPPRRPDIGLQVLWMRRHFPQFRYERQGRWLGVLKPTTQSPAYKVEIACREGRAPQVFVVHPEIDPDAPHRYRDHSLCLYFPPEWRWSEERIIAKSIAPWTSVWLYCYEYWLETGEWYDEEAPHGRRKMAG